MSRMRVESSSACWTQLQYRTNVSQRFLALLLGIAIGFGLAFSVFRLRAPAERPEQSQNGDWDTALLEKSGRAMERIAELEGERDQLASAVDALSRRVAAQIPKGSSTSAPPSPSSQRVHRVPDASAALEPMRAFLRESAVSRVEKLRERLELTPDQADQIQAILERPLNRLNKESQIETTVEETSRQGQKLNSLDQAILDLLTPEQKTAYADLQVEERRKTAQTLATTEVALLDQQLGLSEDQRQQALLVLTEEGERWLRPSKPGSKHSKEEAFRESQERKTEALSGVLTPEQLRSYRSLQELQSALMKRNPRGKRATNDSKASQP